MIEKYKDRLKAILSDEKVVKKRRSTKRRSKVRLNKKSRSAKRRSTKRRSTKRRSTKRGMLFGGELQIDSLDELKKVPEGELERVAEKRGFKKRKNMDEIKGEIDDMIKKRNEASAEELKTLGVLHNLKQYYDNNVEKRNKFNTFNALGVKQEYMTDNFINQASNYLQNSFDERVAKETPPELTPDEKQKIMQMWRRLPKPEQKFINEHEKDLTNEEMRELINKVHSYYQTNPKYNPDDSFFKELNEFSTGSSAPSSPLIAEGVLKQINKRKQEELKNSGTKDPDAEVLFKQPKRESLANKIRNSLRRGMRLPTGALKGISAGDDGPKTLEELKAAARGSVRRPDDDDDGTV